MGACQDVFQSDDIGILNMLTIYSGIDYSTLAYSTMGGFAAVSANSVSGTQVCLSDQSDLS